MIGPPRIVEIGADRSRATIFTGRDFQCCDVKIDYPNGGTVVLTLKTFGTVRSVEDAERYLRGEPVELLT